MRSDTFEHLEALCATRRVVCERRGKKVLLTVPDGSVQAECDGVRDALDTMRTDPTFKDLPLDMARVLPPAEAYDYEVREGSRVTQRTTASSLNEALDQLGWHAGWHVLHQFYGMAVVRSSHGHAYGVTWKRVENNS